MRNTETGVLKGNREHEVWEGYAVVRTNERSALVRWKDVSV